nr:hypothetical protein [Helicobacter pylori]
MAIRFGVIFIVDFLRAISVDDKNKQLRSILERKKKCNSIKFYELYSSITEITAFVVFTDESDAILNLKNYLLVLSKNFNNSRNIWYCENFVRNTTDCLLGLYSSLATLTTLLILIIKPKSYNHVFVVIRIVVFLTSQL